MKGGTKMPLRLLLCFFVMSFLLLSSCGVYSKVPPINPEHSEWEGPLLDQADIENVRIVVKPHERSITLNLKDLDADVSLILQYVQDNRPDLLQQYTFKTSDSGHYILVISKQEREVE